MKKFSILPVLALSALVLTNCTTKEIEIVDASPAEQEGVPFEIIALTGDETRTTVNGMNTSWVADDAINLFHAVAGETTYTNDGQFTIASENINTGQFTGTLADSPAQGTAYDWYAIYPYDASLIKINDKNGTNRYYKLGAEKIDDVWMYPEQSGFDDAHLSLLPLYGVKKNERYNGTAAPIIQMHQFASVAAVTITNRTSATINISSISLTAPENIVGTYRFNILGDNVVYTPSSSNYVSNTATLNVINCAIAKDDEGVFYLPIKPFTAAMGSTISLTVSTSTGETQTKEFNLTKDYTFYAGKMKTVKMDFTTEHNNTPFVQIQSLDEIVSDGEYMFVLPDGVDSYYYAVQVAGTSGNLADISNGIVLDGGLLKCGSPNAKLIWTIGETSESSGVISYNFKNGDYCIWKPSSDTDINTKYSGSCYWAPEALGNNLFSLKSGNRYLAEGTSTTILKNYETFINQVSTHTSLPAQRAGAWAILRRGGTTLPSSGIGFSTEHYVFILGDGDYNSFAGQTLTNPHGVSVTWTSSNEDLATVSNNGTVTFVPNMVGTTTISASYSSDGTYKTETVSYTITVKSGANGYLLVDTAPDDWTGKYVIAYVNNDNAILLGAKSSSGNYATYSNSITIVNNVIDASAGAPYQVSIDKTTNGYSLLFEGTSSYLGYTGTSTSGNNYLYYDNTFAAPQYEWSITLGSNSYVTIKNVYNTSRVLKYNSTSGQERFACYTSAQNLVKLFKLQGDEPELSPLASIAVSGQKTQFIEGTDFTLGEGVVTATYEDGSTRDVTSLVTQSGYNKNTLGQQTVTLSYTEEGITKTTEYNVTVIAKTVTELQLSSFTTIWTVGNPWVWDGTAKAKYDNGSTNTLTSSDLSFTFKNSLDVSVTAEAMMSTAGNYTITVAYTENGTTVTANINITVNNAVTSGYDEVFTFNSAAWGSTNSNGYSNAFTSGKDGNLSSGYVQVTTSNSGANATSNYVFGDLQTVKVIYHTNSAKGVGTISVKVGSVTRTFTVTKPSSGGTTDKTATFDFSNESPTGVATLTVDCSENSIYIKSIEFIGEGEITEAENDDDDDDATTVSMSSFSSVSGNVGEDSNVSYLAEKGSAGTAPVVNNNQIRIYQNGGLLTVSANNGKKLTSVTIGSAMNTTVQVSIDGGTYSSNNSISENGRFSAKNLNATSITFKCTGTTSSTRLYLNYLSVSYK